MAKASAKVVFSFATRNRFWFGMMSSVSTTLCSSTMPCSATRILRMPSKWNGLVITPTVRMPASFAQRATTRPAAHAGGHEHHVGALEMIADLVDRFLGRCPPDFRLRAGAEPFGDGHAHLDDALGLGHRKRLGVGVGDHEVDPLQPARDHVVD